MGKAQAKYTDILRTDYCEYVKFVHSGDWTPTPFHTYLCDYVQSFIERKSNKPYEILCISTPPQHGKSVTITETLASWFLGNNPKSRVIEISYNEDFAVLFGRRNREKIEQYGKDIFGIEISKDKNTARDFELKAESGTKGSMISRGVMTGVTGRKCDLMIIDDPIKNSQEAMSQVYRDRLYSEWVNSFKTRLWVGSKVIIIMTRWHEDDLVGRLLKEEENIEVINFPCECDDELTDPLKRKIGDALCPEIGKDNNWLKQFKASFSSIEGSMTWNALYQGRPTAIEGNLIQRDWWNFYDSEKDKPEIVDWVMSVDASFKDDKSNDFVAIQIWGKNGASIYLVDAVKKHLNFPATIMEIRRLRGMYDKCKITLIEDKANGSAIITMLKRELVGIIPVNPQGSKIARVQAVIGAIESGNVYLPKNKRFVADFINECASFPNGKHDDQVDAMSQALMRMIFMRSELVKEERKSDFEKMFPSYFAGRKKGLGRINVI